MRCYIYGVREKKDTLAEGRRKGQMKYVCTAISAIGGVLIGCGAFNHNHVAYIIGISCVTVAVKLLMNEGR